MKKVNYMILGLAVCFCLSACQDDIEIPTLPEDVYATSDSTAVGDDCIVIEIAEGKAATRTAYSGLSSTMETGDQIGVYAWNGTTPVASNIRFTRQSNGSWAPASNVPYNASYTYCAYFPYRSDHGYTPATSGTVDVRFATFISDANNKFWTTDQSSKANFTSANLCIGQGTHVGSGRRVTFTLDHKRGLAVFTGDAVDAIFTGNQPYTIDTQRYFLMKPSTSTSFTDNLGLWTYSLTAAVGKYVTHNVVVRCKDLGLPSGLKWAEGNIVKDNEGNYSMGTETDYGCYFQWGDIVGHNQSEGVWMNNDTYPNTSGYELTTDIASNDASHDAARARLGSPWHMPTRADWDELKNYTDQEWVKVNGVLGKKFMKKSDHSIYIFLPNNGQYSGSSVYNTGDYGHGYYATSTFCDSNNQYYLNTQQYSIATSWTIHRSTGLGIRAVQ